MDDAQVGELLDQLRSRAPQVAWATFLERYSPVIIKVVRVFERDEDAVGDCFLFVCEQLSQHGFRRLLRFRVDGPARFTTWLCAVARNLCVDWHRREAGRHRVFASVGRLSALDQQIFQRLYVELLPLEEAFLRLRPAFPQLDMAQVTGSAARIERTLTPRQRWLLTVRRARAPSGAGVPTGLGDGMVWEAPDETPDPEACVGLQEQRTALLAAMSGLSPRERLLVRLRYGHSLTLDEIAHLLQLGNAQAADRRIGEAVDKLRMAMGLRGKP